MSKSAKNSNTSGRTFSAEERAAMAERVAEIRGGKVIGEDVVLAKIKGMQEPDRGMAKRIHEIVMKTVPQLIPRSWYGMPAYTNRDGKVICFFQSGKKYKSRYCTFGFQDAANLDEGNMWAAGFALKKLGPAEEKKIAELIKKAVR